MPPWSVRPIAGISSSAARCTMAAMRLAPSSSEYSVWLWRWTKVFGACDILLAGLAETPPLVYLGPSNESCPGRVEAHVVKRALLGLLIASLGPGRLRLAAVKLHH